MRLSNLLLDAAVEVGKGQFSFHFTGDASNSLEETALVAAHLVLVLLNGGLLLERAAESLGAFLKFVCDLHDLILGLFEAVLVGNALKLVSLSDKACVFLLNASLLIHDLGDFITHHFSHLLSSIALEHVKEVQLFVHAFEDDLDFERLQRLHFTHIAETASANNSNNKI